MLSGRRRSGSGVQPQSTQKSSNRLSSCTNKRGNDSFNHVGAALGLSDAHNAESFGDYTVRCAQRQDEALHSAVAHLKVKCGKMLTSLSLLSQHHGRRRHTRTAVSLSLNLSLVLIYIMDGSFSLQDRVNT